MEPSPSQDEILDLIYSAAASIVRNPDRKLTPETRLLGADAVIDSMGLVNLIVEVEQRLAERFSVSCTLADARAMSRQKSPFRSIGSLSEYVAEVVHGTA
jgi:acyl carrier protein